MPRGRRTDQDTTPRTPTARPNGRLRGLCTNPNSTRGDTSAQLNGVVGVQEHSGPTNVPLNGNLATNMTLPESWKTESTIAANLDPVLVGSDSNGSNVSIANTNLSSAHSTSLKTLPGVPLSPPISLGEWDKQKSSNGVTYSLKPGGLSSLLSQWGRKGDGPSLITPLTNATFSPSWIQMIDKVGLSKSDSVCSSSTGDSPREPDDEIRHVKELLTRERVARIIVEQQLVEERVISRQQQEAFQQEQERLEEELEVEQNLCRELEQRVEELAGQLTESEQRSNELEITLSVAQHALEEYRHSEPCDWVLERQEIHVCLSEAVIGVGAWGRVMEGTFRKCKVAVKQIHELILSPHNRRLFEREMSIASRCRHPCLLQFIGATNDDQSPLFVTELLDTSLRAVLHERVLTPTEIKTLALDVTIGLNYLHLNKPIPIIHRDISSSNVLLWKHHDSWRGKVSDYGTANFMHHSMTISPGAIVYSPPEAQTSRQSPKLDVYSFGVLLCEMNIREFPDTERREEQVALVTNHMFRDLIRRCLQEDHERRPSMVNVIDTLQEIKY